MVKHKSLMEEHPELLNEWDYELNVGLKPNEVSCGSGRKIHWICDEGHKYLARIPDKLQKKCPYCSGRYPIVGENDLATVYPEIASQWNYMLNGNLLPEQVTSRSDHSVWWICKKGHEWKAKVYNRAYGSGCPYCDGQKPVIGENDLASVRPDLAEQWNYCKNEGLKPKDVMLHTNKKVWWTCNKGHEWKASASNRARGTRCPYCSGNVPIVGKNDFVTLHPDLAKQWDYQKNGSNKPSQYKEKSNYMAWWICEKGHSYETQISHRTEGKGCPFCSGRYPYVGETDLKTTNPDLAKEWDYEKNGNCIPQSVTQGSDKVVWWKCSKCGMDWKTSVYNRTVGCGCPYCIGKIPIVGKTDLETVNPDIAKEWNYDKNHKMIPSMYTSGSNKKVWWKCQYGHSWRTQIIERARHGTMCPQCRKKVSSLNP